ncbi:hypothetical protein [Nonomuraea sp. NPDC050310]|uniref:hypothetical protein n=1 Tax=Nonomuraea sp. NPDC050310 TaxID=3154935 RepID=UPI0033C353C5
MRFRRGAKAALKAAMQGAVYGATPARQDRSTLGELVDRLGKRAVVERLAGTGDPKSRAYKNARDNLGRYLRGTRTPSAAAQHRLQKVAKSAQVDQLRSKGAVRVAVTADVRKSARMWKNGHMAAILDGAALQDYCDAMERGDEAGALEIVMEEYGLPADEVAEIAHVHGVDIF